VDRGWQGTRSGIPEQFCTGEERSCPNLTPRNLELPDPVLITDAARSYEEELKVRKRRYAVMMGMRVPCMVLAAVFYQTLAGGHAPGPVDPTAMDGRAHCERPPAPQA
jgi:hypothetical protein